jgi:hypothetical protein
MSNGVGGGGGSDADPAGGTVEGPFLIPDGVGGGGGPDPELLGGVGAGGPSGIDDGVPESLFEGVEVFVNDFNFLLAFCSEIFESPVLDIFGVRDIGGGGGPTDARGGTALDEAGILALTAGSDSEVMGIFLLLVSLTESLGFSSFSSITSISPSLISVLSSSISPKELTLQYFSLCGITSVVNRSNSAI